MSAGAFATFRTERTSASALAAVEEHASHACAIATAILGDAETAEAIVADVLAEGLGAAQLPVEGGADAERAWVVAAVRAQALAFARMSRKSRFGRRSRAEAPSPAKEAWAAANVDAGRAQAAFEALPIAARTALGLAYGAGLPPSEVGRKMGFGADEVRDLLRDGLLEIDSRLDRGAP